MSGDDRREDKSRVWLTSVRIWITNLEGQPDWRFPQHKSAIPPVLQGVDSCDSERHHGSNQRRSNKLVILEKNHQSQVAPSTVWLVLLISDSGLFFLRVVETGFSSFTLTFTRKREHFPPVTMTCEPDLDRVKTKHRAKYLGRRSFQS